MEYDGTLFNGWQSQADGSGVQDAVETALSKFNAEGPKTIVAGRTDSGVHARGQVISVDLARPYVPKRLCDGLNAHLRHLPIVALQAEVVAADFSARLHAKERHYEYHIINRRMPLALLKNRAWHIRRPLDITLMQAGAQYLIGLYDFSSFRASNCQAQHALRRVNYIDIVQDGDDIFCRIGAKSFLHHQVRNMVGTLVSVGHGLRTPEDVKTILEAKERALAGVTAPPDGLYFTRVDY